MDGVYIYTLWRSKHKEKSSHVYEMLHEPTTVKIRDFSTYPWLAIKHIPLSGTFFLILVQKTQKVEDIVISGTASISHTDSEILVI